MVAANESPRQVVSHTIAKTSSTKRITPDDKMKKRSSQISKELSDMVVYVQVITMAFKCAVQKIELFLFRLSNLEV